MADANATRKPADRSNWALLAGAVFMLVGFLTQNDLKYSDDPVQVAYSISLGAGCEADIKACHMHANPATGFRAETTRNEVTEYDPHGNQSGGFRLYTGCMIWSAADWSCEGGRISMTHGVILHDELLTDPDTYYVPRIAWKMAKLHILPLDSVRKAKPEPPKRKQGA